MIEKPEIDNSKVNAVREQSFSNGVNAIKDFLNQTLEEIVSILGAQSGSLFIFNPENEELILDTYLNSHDIQPGNVRKRIGEGISGKVVEFKAPVLVRDIDSDSRFIRNGFNHYQTKSFISIPIFSADRLIGVINIADKVSGEPFCEKDLRFAVTLCKYACIAIEKGESQRIKKSTLEKYASVGKLAAGVVHEINNPLDGIIRYTNIILEQIRENSSTREYLLEVKKGLSRIGNITKSLLEFSHIINSDSPKFKKYASLCDLIDESLDILRARLNDNIKVLKKCCLTPIRILDIGITRVLVNIIENAIEAMPAEGGTIEITTGINDVGIYVSFKDTGGGISPEIQERIFEPFYTTKGIEKGTGLGLAIASEIVHKYEGSIEVSSSPGQGSTFTVLVPRKYTQE